MVCELAHGLDTTREDAPGGGAFETACRLAAGRQYTQAEHHFCEALSENAFAALCGRAICLYRTGRLSEALASAGRACELEPTKGEPRFIAGLILKDAGRYNEAIEEFTSAVELGYSRSAGLYHRGAAHFLSGRLEAAEHDFEEVTRALPASSSAFYNLGVTRVHRSRWREAAEAFSTCARLDPAGSLYYHEILFGIGRAQASEEFHLRGHRVKNMLAILADSCRRSVSEDHSSEGSEADEVSLRLERVLAEMGELLNFVRRDPLELDVWDMHDVIENALLQAGERLIGVKVVKEFDSRLPGAVCDAHVLSEAFLNVIMNAAEVMSGGGTLTIRTSREGPAAVRVEFEDTGGGVQAKPPERIFQFAFTTKPNGNGLGLCQTVRAAEEHGGCVMLERGREGACFAVVLPLTARIGERIQDIGLKPDLSDDVKLPFVGMAGAAGSP
jgi:signal transduction histidine kinase